MGAYTKQKFLSDIENPAFVRRALQKLKGALFFDKESERLVPDTELAQKLLGVAGSSTDPAHRQAALEVFESMIFVKPTLATIPDLARQVARISVTDADTSVRSTAHDELARVLENNTEATSPATEAAMNVLKPYATDPDIRVRFDALHTLRLFVGRSPGYAQEVLTLADDAATSLNGHVRRAGHAVRAEVLEKKPDLSSASLAGDLARAAVADPNDIARDWAREALEVLLNRKPEFGSEALNEIKRVIFDPMAPRHQDYEMRRDEQKTLAVIVQASPALKDHVGALVNDGLKDHAVEVRYAAQEALQPRESSVRATCPARYRRGLGC